MMLSQPCLYLQDASIDEASKAAARSSRQLEAAVMQQRLDNLQQQQHHLHQQLAALPPEQQQLAAHHQQHLQQQLEQQEQQHAREQRGRGRGRGGTGRGSRGRGRKGPAAAAGGQGLPGWPTEAAADADCDAGAAAEAGVQVAFVETERDRLIRCGLLTPFDKLDGFDMQVQGAPDPQQPQQPPQQTQQQLSALPGVLQQQLPSAGLLGRTSSSGRHRSAQNAAAPVDGQWALLMRNAVPVDAAAAAAGAVPSEVADLANQVGRGGLPLSELLARAAQQTVEVGITNRPRAILMEPGEVSASNLLFIACCGCRWWCSGVAVGHPQAFSNLQAVDGSLLTLTVQLHAIFPPAGFAVQKYPVYTFSILYCAGLFCGATFHAVLCCAGAQAGA